VTNFCRISKNSFLFGPATAAAASPGAISNAGHDFGNDQLDERGGKALIADLKTF
jgi:hypothetical protein